MQTDEKRCWFWWFPEGPGGLRNSHQQICTSSKRTELPIGAPILLIIKTPFSCNPFTHSGFCRKIRRQTWFTPQQRIFPSHVKSKHFYSWSLNTYQERIGGWPLAFVRKVKTHLAPHSLLAQTILIAWLGVWQLPFWARALFLPPNIPGGWNPDYILVWKQKSAHWVKILGGKWEEHWCSNKPHLALWSLGEWGLA